MARRFILILALLINVSAAPFLHHLSIQPMVNQQMHSMNPVVNQIMEEQMLEQLLQQNQYNALQQQLIPLQQLQPQHINTMNGPMML